MSDLTTQVLIDIRDELRGTNTRLDQTNARIDQTNARLERTNASIEETNATLHSVIERQTESEIRVATELVGVRHAVDRLTDLIRTDRSLRGDVDDLKTRVASLERKTG
jgi:methyl-accepting chemotaxis protein